MSKIRREKCLEVLHAALGQPVALTEFRCWKSRGMTAAERDAALAGLVAEGIAALCEPGPAGKGRRPVCYRLLPLVARRKAVAR